MKYFSSYAIATCLFPYDTPTEANRLECMCRILLRFRDISQHSLERAVFVCTGYPESRVSIRRRCSHSYLSFRIKRFWRVRKNVHMTEKREREKVIDLFKSSIAKIARSTANEKDQEGVRWRNRLFPDARCFRDIPCVLMCTCAL